MPKDLASRESRTSFHSAVTQTVTTFTVHLRVEPTCETVGDIVGIGSSSARSIVQVAPIGYVTSRVVQSCCLVVDLALVFVNRWYAVGLIVSDSLRQEAHQAIPIRCSRCSIHDHFLQSDIVDKGKGLCRRRCMNAHHRGPALSRDCGRRCWWY